MDEDAEALALERSCDHVLGALGGEADEHDLAGEGIGGNAAADEIDRRYRRTRRKGAEAQPEVAVRVDRNVAACDGQGAIPDRDRVGAARDPRQFHGQSRVGLIPDPRHGRHAAEYAVGVGRGADDAKAASAVLKLRDRGECLRIAPGARRDRAGDFGLDRQVRGIGAAGIDASAGEDGRGEAHGLAEQVVVGGEGGKALRGRLVELGEELRHHRRPERVGLGEDDVVADRERAAAVDFLRQAGEMRARPRPAAKRGQALGIDLDDSHPRIGEVARAQLLPGVEQRAAEPFAGKREQHCRHRRREQTRQADPPQRPGPVRA